MAPPLIHSRATFQTKFFFAALSAAIIALAVAGVLFATTMRSRIDERIESTLVAEARLAADLLGRGVPLTSVAALDDEADRLGALVGARVTFIAAGRPGARRLVRDGRGGRGHGESRTAPGGAGCGGPRARAVPALQRDPEDRHAVRRGAGASPGDRLRAGGAAAHRRPPSAAAGAERDADRAQHRVARRRRHRVDLLRANRPAGAADRRHRRSLSPGRSHAAAARLRRRRAWDGGARAQRVGAGSRTPSRRAGAGSRAHGSHPRRHGRRGHRRRSAGAAAARERRGAADAQAGRWQRRDRAGLCRDHQDPGDRRTGGRACCSGVVRRRWNCRRRATPAAPSWRPRRRRPAPSRTA